MDSLSTLGREEDRENTRLSSELTLHGEGEVAFRVGALQPQVGGDTCGEGLPSTNGARCGAASQE